ncbi:HAD family hydrolase [Caldalkalibacillus mannanilyticus]|uniref:HAD family hydrolase n=1 Tax=Caldalkalibacillus mannanilyticus TaxID=1418 RepID=UPI00046A86D3|nr:HAD-IA family hydrolase [Caldalkalibacillus mannanilyticus]
MKYKTILFDFDGTLADTLPICFYSFQKVFQKYDNRELSNHDILAMFGPSEIGIIKQNLSNKMFVEQAIEDYYDMYHSKHSELVKPNEGIINMINDLKIKGISLGIVTGKARRSYEISINHLFGLDPFEISITGDDVLYPKPHPEGILKAIKLLDSSIENTLFIGDSDADIKAGIDAGVSTVGVNWLDNSHGSIFTYKPDYEYDRIEYFINELIHEVI